jgi:hypothetical protein
MRVEWQTKSCRDRLISIENRMRMGLPMIVFDSAVNLERATKPRVPIRTGKLRGSGEVGRIQGYPQIYQELKYKAHNPRDGYNYAAIQHEVAFRHPKGGEDHYLLNSVKENSNTIFMSRLSSGIQRLLI